MMKSEGKQFTLMLGNKIIQPKTTDFGFVNVLKRSNKGSRIVSTERFKKMSKEEENDLFESQSRRDLDIFYNNMMARRNKDFENWKYF